MLWLGGFSTIAPGFGLALFGSSCANPITFTSGAGSGPWTAVRIASAPRWGTASEHGTQLYYTAVSNTTGTDHLSYYLVNASGTDPASRP